MEMVPKEHPRRFIKFFSQPLRFVLVFPRANSRSVHFVDNTKLGIRVAIEQDEEDEAHRTLLKFSRG